MKNLEIGDYTFTYSDTVVEIKPFDQMAAPILALLQRIEELEETHRRWEAAIPPYVAALERKLARAQDEEHRLSDRFDYICRLTGW